MEENKAGTGDRVCSQGGILVFYCCITNYQKLRSLKLHPSSRHSLGKFSAQYLTKLQSRSWPELRSHLTLGVLFKFRILPGWQNSVPCSWRTQGRLLLHSQQNQMTIEE